MANLVSIYTDGTAGAKDGTAVSADRVFSAPVSIDINVGENETVVTPLAVRCEEGKTASAVTISTDVWDESTNAWSGTNNSMISFSKNADGSNSQNSLKLTSITDTNTIVYMVVTSSDLQEPGTDKLTAITLAYTVSGA